MNDPISDRAERIRRAIVALRWARDELAKADAPKAAAAVERAMRSANGLMRRPKKADSAPDSTPEEDRDHTEPAQL